MTADKRLRSWILIAIVLIIAIAAPMYSVKRGEPAIRQGIDLVGGVDLLIRAEVPEGETEVTPDMMTGAMEIVRNRIDPEGVKEVVIQKVGEDRISVQVPGEDDPQRIIDILGDTATLKFINAGTDAIPEGTRLRYIDAATGAPPGETAAAPEPVEELQPSTVMPDQVVLQSADIAGFILETEGEPSQAGTVGEEITETEPLTPVSDPTVTSEESAPESGGQVVVLQVNPPGTQLAFYSSQHLGEYLSLVESNKVRASVRIAGSLTQSKIAFPGLAESERFSLDELNANIAQMKVIGTVDALPVGTPVEIFDPMGASETQEEEPVTAVMDITLDKVILTGDDFANAEVTFGQVGQPIISFEFKPHGRETFGRFTAQNVDKFLAIALDDVIISCPVVREPILNGRGVIEGSFSIQEAQDLVVKLDSGRLPVPLTVMENRSIGPMLGEKSILQSKRAAIAGAILVMLFMAFYYRYPGFMANISLLFYGAVVFGCMSILNATLTLPGIAGFVMSIGMAVDANVIIFERIKEELRTGKTFRAAIDAGFKRAFSAVFDSHVASLISALVLYNLGTGAIKGFAVTLALGCLVSLFSSITVTRALLESSIENPDLQNHKLFGVKAPELFTRKKGVEQ